MPEAATSSRRATMQDVAELAGVSLKTVSRVVNDEPSVNPRTYERVRSAIDELGYRRNGIASSLGSGASTHSLGLVIGDIKNPFYSDLAAAIEQAARANGEMLITVSAEDNAAQERAAVSSLVERRVDGLILTPSDGTQAYLEAERDFGLPVVFVDRPPNGCDGDAVLIDNVEGGHTAAAHLLAGGHERIALVGDSPRLFTARHRVAGFEQAHVEAGREIEPGLVRVGSHSASEAEATMLDLLALRRPPTAVFTTNNRNTIGVLRALGARRHRVALVGFDDFEVANLIDPGITVVAHDAALMGRTAYQMLQARRAGDDGEYRHVVLPTHLVARGSGEIPPWTD